MKALVIIGMYALLAGTTTSSRAYEISTHALLSRAAVQASFLGTNDALIKNLGLDSASGVPDLGRIYLDSYLGGNLQRIADDPFFYPAPYETKVMKDLNFEELSLQATGWIVRGAIREDDLPWFPLQPEELRTPQDDPYAQRVRVFQHWFDPYNNQPFLNAACLGELADGGKCHRCRN